MSVLHRTLRIKKSKTVRLLGFLSVFLGLLVLILVLISQTIGLRVGQMKNKQESLVSKFFPVNGTVSLTVTPTSSLPTPTLTQQQLAEIRKKTFEEHSKKFGPCRYVPVLMYHHVMPNDQAKVIGAAKLNVPPENFRSQMDYLISKGYQTVSLEEMINGIRNNSLPVKPVVLTFDDGYLDFFDYVYPILKEKGIKATVFVISQFAGGDRYATWDQLRDMAGSGLVTIGDHTLNHVSLPSLSAEGQKNQIVSAKQVIEQNIGRPVNTFAYPYGNSNANAKKVLSENGFIGAVVTTNTSPQCVGLPYDLSRIRIGAASLANWGL